MAADILPNGHYVGANDPRNAATRTRRASFNQPSYDKVAAQIVEAARLLEDENIGGPIPKAGKEELLVELTEIQNKLERLNATRRTLGGAVSFQFKVARLEERVKRFKQGIETSAKVAQMRLKAEQDARRPKSERAKSSATMVEQAKTTPRGTTALSRSLHRPGEVFWCTHYDFIHSRGYRLRKRYAPDWIPSFGPRSNGEGHEDALVPETLNIMDAVRLEDATPVHLKHVSRLTHPFEVQISLLFSSRSYNRHRSIPENAFDPLALRNRCVDVYTSFRVPQLSLNDESEILVMKQLRPFDSPPFENIYELLDFWMQSFQALYYLHRQFIVHGNPTLAKFMLDGTPMYPHGYHPVAIDKLPDVSGPAVPSHTRTELARQSILPNDGYHHPILSKTGVQYYITDFSEAYRWDPSRIPPGEVLAKAAGPSGGEPPYAKDVKILGESILREFFEPVDVAPGPYRQGHYRAPSKSSVTRPTTNYSQAPLAFLRPLAEEMVHPDPALRPTMERVLLRYHELTKGLGESVLLEPVFSPINNHKLKSGGLGKIFRRSLEVWSGLSNGANRNTTDTMKPLTRTQSAQATVQSTSKPLKTQDSSQKPPKEQNGISPAQRRSMDYHPSRIYRQPSPQLDPRETTPVIPPLPSKTATHTPRGHQISFESAPAAMHTLSPLPDPFIKPPWEQGEPENGGPSRKSTPRMRSTTPQQNQLPPQSHGVAFPSSYAPSAQQPSQDMRGLPVAPPPPMQYSYSAPTASPWHTQVPAPAPSVVPSTWYVPRSNPDARNQDNVETHRRKSKKRSSSRHRSQDQSSSSHEGMQARNASTSGVPASQDSSRERESRKHRKSRSSTVDPQTSSHSRSHRRSSTSAVPVQAATVHGVPPYGSIPFPPRHPYAPSAAGIPPSGAGAWYQTVGPAVGAPIGNSIAAAQAGYPQNAYPPAGGYPYPMPAMPGYPHPAMHSYTASVREGDPRPTQYVDPVFNTPSPQDPSTSERHRSHRSSSRSRHRDKHREARSTESR